MGLLKPGKLPILDLQNDFMLSSNAAKTKSSIRRRERGNDSRCGRTSRGQQDNSLTCTEWEAPGSTRDEKAHRAGHQSIGVSPQCAGPKSTYATYAHGRAHHPRYYESILSCSLPWSAGCASHARVSC